MSDIEFRVRRLEEDGKEIRSDLKTIMVSLAEIKASVATKTDLSDVKVAVAKVETRIDKLPSFTKVGILAALAVAVMTAAVRWNELSVYFGGAAPPAH